jgi:hypothetical protein
MERTQSWSWITSNHEATILQEMMIMMSGDRDFSRKLTNKENTVQPMSPCAISEFGICIFRLYLWFPAVFPPLRKMSGKCTRIWYGHHSTRHEFSVRYTDDSCCELYRPSDRRWSANLVPTFADRWSLRPYSRLCRPEPLLSCTHQ